MRSSAKPALSAKVKTDMADIQQQERLAGIFRNPQSLEWNMLLSELRKAGAGVKSQNGEAFVSIGGRHLLIPKMRGAIVAPADLAFLRRALALPMDAEAESPQEALRLVVAIDDRCAHFYRALLPPKGAAWFIALEPYDRHVYARYAAAGETVVEMDGAYFEWLSMALATARQILLVELGASTAGMKFLHFLRRHHPPIAMRLAGGAAFGAPGATDRALLALARRYFGVF